MTKDNPDMDRAALASIRGEGGAARKIFQF
jgi:hypothetical protein